MGKYFSVKNKFYAATVFIIFSLLCCWPPSPLHAATSREYWNSDSGNQMAVASVVDSEGNIIITGTSNKNGTDDFYTIKIKADLSGVLWRSTFDRAGGTDTAVAVAVDSDDNVIVTGVGNRSGVKKEMVTIKYCGKDVTTPPGYDPVIPGTPYPGACTAGEIMWTATYDGPARGNNYPTSLAVDADKNIYVGGYGQSLSGGDDDFILLKYAPAGPNADGSPSWQQSYGGSNGDNDYITDVTTCSPIGGQYFVAVTGHAFDTSNSSIHTIKYDSAGTRLWQQTLTAKAKVNEVAPKIAMDSSCNVVVSGSVVGSGSNDIYTIKYAADTGQELWNQTYAGSGDDQVNDVYADKNNDVFLAGMTFVNQQDDNFYTARLNGSTGAVLWEKIYDSGYWDSALSVGVDNTASAVYVTGASLDSNNNYDSRTIMYRLADGNLLGNSTFDSPTGNQNDWPIGMSRTAAGEILVTGYIDNLAILSAHSYSDWRLPTSTTGSKSFVLKNGCRTAVALTGVTLSGSDAGQFSVAPGGSSPCESLSPTLAPGASCTMLVTFDPTSSGAKAATMMVSTASGSQGVPLSATAYSRLAGTITEMATSLPISGATVTLNTGATATTNSSGAYVFAPLTPGTYWVTVTKTGYPNLSKDSLAVNEMSTAIADFTMSAFFKRFVDIGDGTMLDTHSNLIWLKEGNCFAPGKTWDNAISASDTLASGQCGLNDGSKAGDWHLPTIDELRIFVDTGYETAAKLDAAGFMNTQSSYYWSSTTTFGSNTVDAWRVNFSLGLVGNDYKTSSCYVRAVRGGQYWSFDNLLILTALQSDWRLPTGTTSSRSVVLTNAGENAAALTGVTLTGSDAGEFSVAPGGGPAPCESLTPTLAPGTACTMMVTVLPETIGVKTASFTVRTASGNQDIPLTVNAYSVVHGIVTDISTGLPVSGATVTLNPGGAWVATNSTGGYNFDISTTGTYSVTVTKTGYSIVTVFNAVTNSQSAWTEVLLSPPGLFNITTNKLPGATAGIPYSARILVSGGTFPYTFSREYGSLPTGLSLDPATGVISGTPTGSGSYTFYIGLTDSADDYSGQEFVLELTQQPVAITTTSLPRATTGSNYPLSITAVGGKAPYTFSVTTGSLPSGLGLSNSGTLTGAPSATGDFSFTVTATDDTGRTATANFSINVDAPLTITTTRLPDAKTGIAYSATIALSGGYGTITWTLYAGVLPSGLTLDAATGQINGTPTETTSRIITLSTTDSIGRMATRSYPLNVTLPVGFATTALPNGHIGDSYTERVRVLGGIAPYSFSMSGILPTGLVFDNATGTISGTPTSGGQKNINITVTDSSYPTPQTNSQSFSIRTTSLLTPATPTILTNARKGTAITPVTFTARGGTSPYTWSHTGGALPGGVTFDPVTATLSGTPTDAGDFSFTLHLSDSMGNATGDTINPDKNFFLQVSDTLTISSTSLPTAALNVPYSATLSVTGGLKPITWAIFSGSLPAGLTLDPATGQLSGAPANNATATFTVRATDSDSPAQTSQKQYTIAVSSTLAIIETSLPAGRQAQPYTANVRAEFGTAPYTWSIIAGALPAGVSLATGSSGATLQGTPSTAGDYSFTLSLNDSGSQSVSRQFSLTVLSPLSITTTTLPAVVSATPYSATIAVTGGQPPYTFAISSGSLLQGLFLNNASGVISGTRASSSTGSSLTITVTDSAIPSSSVSRAYTLAALTSVSVTKNEAAAGTITSIPSGINCGASCTTATASFAAGTQVQMTAAPSPGYYLSSWTSCDSTDGADCTVSARDGLPTITASFSRQALTQLSLDLSSSMILQAGTINTTGKLTPLPDTGNNLSNLPITLTITAPDSSTTTVSTVSSDTAGHYRLEGITGFTLKGAYTIRAAFAGSATLTASASQAQTLMVGAQAGYAIIVQGKISNDEGLESHAKTTNRVYKTLKTRGFNDEGINYLSYQTSQQATAAGVIVDNAPSKSAVQAAISTWALNKLRDMAAPLYLIMIDHGANGSFMINNEIITPSDLDNWLSALETGLEGYPAATEPRIVIDGSCYSGSFIPTLSGPGRIIVTSAASDEESYKGPLEPDGVRSGEYFMDTLFQQLKEGRSLKTAFDEATALIRTYTRKGGSSNSLNHYGDNAVQHPMLDDDGSGAGSNLSTDLAGDGAAAKDIYLGVGDTLTNAAGNAEITAVTPTLYLNSVTSSANPWLTTIGAQSAVASAWAEVRNPGLTLNPTGSSTGQLDLTLDKQLMQPKAGTTHTWELPTAYTGFSMPGKYEIYYYAREAASGDISAMQRSVVYKKLTGNTAPAAPLLLTPDNDSSQKTHILFTWDAATDPENDPVTYTLRIAQDAAFTQVVYTLEEIPFTVASIGAEAGLSDLSAYWWRIEAIDQYGNSSASGIWRFATDNTNGLPSILKGYVTASSNNSPIAGATVTMSSGRTSTTLPNGEYWLLLTQPETLTMTASAAGYRTSDPVSVPGLSGSSIQRNVSLSILSDTTAPTITSFSIPATSSSLTVSVTLTATDAVGVTGYCLQETSGSAGCTWNSTAPVNYTFSSEGSKTLHAYAKDAAGNVSDPGDCNIIVKFGVRGDVNGDESVGLADAVLAVKSLSGNATGVRSAYTSSGADVNGDQMLGMAEVIYILQKIARVR